MVAAKPTHVLNCYNRYISGLDFLNEFIPTLAVKGCATDPIVLEVTDVGKSMLTGEILQNLHLVKDGVRGSALLVVLRQPLIKSGCLGWIGGCVPSRGIFAGCCLLLRRYRRCLQSQARSIF